MHVCLCTPYSSQGHALLLTDPYRGNLKKNLVSARSAEIFLEGLPLHLLLEHALLSRPKTHVRACVWGEGG